MSVPPSLLVMQRRGGAAPSVQRLTGGTTLSGAIDGTFSVNEAFTNTSSFHQIQGGAVEFKGLFYATVREVSGGNSISKVYRRSGGSWAQVYADAAGTTGGNNRNTGLYVVNTGSGPVLCFVFARSTAGADIKLAKTTDGTSWTTTDVIPATSDWTAASTFNGAGVIVHRGQIYIPFRSAQGHVVVDVLGGAATKFNSSGGTAQNTTTDTSFVSFRGKVYGATRHDSAKCQFREFVGGSLAHMFNLGNGASNPNAGSMPPMLFNFNDQYIGVIFLDASSTTTTYYHQFAKLVPSGNTFTVTYHPTVIPSELRDGGSAASKENYAYICFADNETDPLNPAYHIWSIGSGAGSYTYMEFVDDATEMVTFPTGFSSTNYGLVHMPQGGGEKVNTTAADLFPDDVAFAPGSVGGTVLVTITIRGGDALNNKTIKGYYNTNESPDFVQMTLTGTATGGSAVRNGNQIDSARADGTVAHTFLWAAESQGIMSGQPVHTKFHVITP